MFTYMSTGRQMTPQLKRWYDSQQMSSANDDTFIMSSVRR